MSQVEKTSRVTEVFRWLRGQPTERETANLMAILAGKINEKHRQQFIQEESNCAFRGGLGSSTSLNPLEYPFSILFTSRALEAARTRERELRSLSEEELDKRVTAAAQERAQRWGLKPPLPFPQ